MNSLGIAFAMEDMKIWIKKASGAYSISIISYEIVSELRTTRHFVKGSAACAPSSCAVHRCLQANVAFSCPSDVRNLQRACVLPVVHGGVADGVGGVADLCSQHRHA